MQKACEAAGATEVFVTDDAAEGEMFVEARRAAFPAIEQRGTLLLEDVGAPVPLLPELLAAITTIADKHDIEIPVVAHAGDGNTHPIIVYDAGDPASAERARLAFDEVMHAAIALGGTITRRARRRTHQEGRSARPARPRRDGADPPGQGRARPRRDPQPGRDPLSVRGGLGSAA